MSYGISNLAHLGSFVGPRPIFESRDFDFAVPLDCTDVAVCESVTSFTSLVQRVTRFPQKGGGNTMSAKLTRLV